MSYYISVTKELLFTTFKHNSRALMISHGKTSNGVLSQFDFCFSAAATKAKSQSLAMIKRSKYATSKAEMGFPSDHKLNPLNVRSCVQYLQKFRKGRVC